MSAQQRQGGGGTLVFSGYVSHQQLTAALGSQLAGDPVRHVLRAAAAAAMGQQQRAGEEQPLATCRVSMHGPRGQGAADVAVSSYTPSDAGHLPSSAAAGAAQGCTSAGSSPGGKPKLLQRAQLLARGVAAAAKQAAAQAAAGPKGSSGDRARELLHLRCALMSLMLPVDMLADCILPAL